MKRLSLLLLAALAVALAACGAASPPAPPDLGDVGGATIAASSRLIDADGGLPGPGDPAPDFAYTMPDGGERSLGDLRGTPVVLNFWATWCLPCIEEMPELQAAYDAAGGDLAVLAVNRNELPEAIARFAPRVGVSFPLIANVDGAIGDRYGVNNLPITFFIGRDGTIVGRHFGALSAEALAEQLEAIQ